MSDRLTWFGDDFTGSSDVLLQYTRAGLPATLFLGAPTADELAAAADRYQAIGIAGVTRSMRTPQIAPVVREAFELLAELEPRVVQYKICSTADSAVNIGSIGPAVTVGRELFGARPVPILVAQPGLGRYTVFANHFGRDATGVHRLDRLPSMANHPVTPMHEADLRRHFAAQLDGQVDSLPITALGSADGAAALQKIFAADPAAFVVDGLADEDLEAAGRLLLDSAPSTLFAVGSGGLSVGLAAAMSDGRPAGGSSAMASTAAPTSRQCLAVSGSAARRTSDQIDAAIDAGWTALPLDPHDLVSDRSDDAVRAIADEAAHGFAGGDGVVVFTAHRSLLPPSESVPSDVVGAALGDVVAAVRRATDIERVVVAGGDTSGYVLTRLGAATLSAIGTVGADLVLGAITSRLPAVDGLEVVLKGGQLGELDVFERARVAH